MASHSSRSGDSDPLLSIVVTIVGGRLFLEPFLEALSRQEDGPPLEILVPLDDSVRNCASLVERFSDVKFLDLGAVATERPAETPGGQHELYDRRRAAGLAAASGELVAILEDRAPPRPDWARTAVRLHRQSAKVIGGAIEFAPGTLLNWSCYICDYSRYSLPFSSGPREWVSDVNVVYKREALEATRDLWKERYQEPIVHWSLTNAGEELLLCPELIVDHHQARRSFGKVLAERFGWGRLFGHIRASQQSIGGRALYVLGSPLIPPLLILRYGRIHFSKGRGFRYLAAVPILPALLASWTLGEVWGTITGRP